MLPGLDLYSKYTDDPAQHIITTAIHIGYYGWMYIVICIWREIVPDVGFTANVLLIGSDNTTKYNLNHPTVGFALF